MAKSAEERAEHAEEEARRAHEALSQLRTYYGAPNAGQAQRADAEVQARVHEEDQGSDAEQKGQGDDSENQERCRADALERMLQLQEGEMREAAECEAHAAAFVDEHTASHSRACARVLSCWRLQVHRLLLQLKSEEATRSQLQRQISQSALNHQRELERLHRLLDVERNRHAASTASASNEHKRAESLSKQIDNLHSKNSELAGECDALRDSLTSVARSASSTLASVESAMHNLSSAFARLDAYTRRLSFASSRLFYAMTLMLQQRHRRHQHHHHDHSQLIASVDHHESNQKIFWRNQSSTEWLSTETQRAVESEVHELQNEREMLLERLQSEVAKREQAEERRDEAERRNVVLESRHTEFEEAVNNKVEQVREELEAEKQRLAKELERVRVEKDEALKQAEESAQQKIEEAEREREEELKEAKREADEARRESARTAIVSKQNEREAERMREEKERGEREKQDLYEEKVRSLEKQVRELRKERNSLMASLRQERQQSASLLLDGRSVAQQQPLSDEAASNAHGRSAGGHNHAYEDGDEEEEGAVNVYNKWRQDGGYPHSLNVWAMRRDESDKISTGPQSRIARFRDRALPQLEAADEEDEGGSERG